MDSVTSDGPPAAGSSGSHLPVLLCEGAPMPLLIVDREGRIRDLNEDAADLFGYACEELRGRPVEVLVPEALRDAHKGHRARYGRDPVARPMGAGIEDLALKGRRADGSPIPLDITLRPFTIGDERYVAASLFDLRGVRRLQRSLNEVGQRLQSFFDGAPGSILVLTPGGRITEANPAACELFGYELEELRGRDAATLYVRPGEMGAHMRAAREAGGRPVEFEFEMRRSDGAPLAVIKRIRLLRSPEGEPIGYLAMALDVSGQREAERALRQSLLEYRDLFESSITPILVTDREGRIEEINPAGSELLGHESDDLLGRYMEELYVDTDAAERFTRAIETAGFLKDYEIQVRDSEGRTLILETNAHVRRSTSGEVTGYVGTLRDVTRERRAREELRASAERFRALFEGSNDAILLHDFEGRILDVNERAQELWGYSRDEFLDLELGQLAGIEGGDVRERLALVQRRRGIMFEEVFQCRDGSRFHGQVSASLLRTDGEKIVQSAVRDVTERKRLEEELTHRAFHHPLTGLPNRALFVEQVKGALARVQRREGNGVAVLFLDLDDLKAVNDSLGHVAGDEVLRSVAARLRGCLREGDVVAHFGGDEFTILLEECEGEKAALMAARRVHYAFDLPVEVEGTEVSITASLGVACSEPSDTASDLLRFADVAMFEAKKRGLGRTHLFDRTGDRRRTDRLERTARLRRAIEDGELRLHYQPLVELDSGRVCGAEALVRWEDPERGTVPPSEFIPLAEETGLIEPIAWWVVEEACRSAGRWIGEGAAPSDFTISINLSAAEFRSPELPDRLADALEKEALSPRRLLLEITEGVLVRGPLSLGPLEALGIRLALDDFGTGYSSLEYLKRLPVDVLKVDRSFVAGLPGEDADRALVGSVLALGDYFGLEVVAEGIEHAEQLEELRRLGCRIGQGFLFSRPIDGDGFEQLLSEGRGLLDA